MRPRELADLVSQALCRLSPSELELDVGQKAGLRASGALGAGTGLEQFLFQESDMWTQTLQLRLVEHNPRLPALSDLIRFVQCSDTSCYWQGEVSLCVNA